MTAVVESAVRERDLDPKVEELILDWSREVSRDARLALLVRLDHPLTRANDAALLRESVHQYFAGRSLPVRRRLHAQFHRGASVSPSDSPFSPFSAVWGSW